MSSRMDQDAFSRLMRSMRCVGVSDIKRPKKMPAGENSGGHGCTRGYTGRATPESLGCGGRDNNSAASCGTTCLANHPNARSKLDSERNGNERSIGLIRESCYVFRFEQEVHTTHPEAETGTTLHTADRLRTRQYWHGRVITLTESEKRIAGHTAVLIVVELDIARVHATTTDQIRYDARSRIIRQPDHD